MSLQQTGDAKILNNFQVCELRLDLEEFIVLTGCERVHYRVVIDEGLV